MSLNYIKNEIIYIQAEIWNVIQNLCFSINATQYKAFTRLFKLVK